LRFETDLTTCRWLATFGLSTLAVPRRAHRERDHAALFETAHCRHRDRGFAGVDPARLTGVWLHPWLRSRLLLRMLLETLWDADTLELVAPRGRAVAAELRRLQRSPWFN
jgi:hypothetical protein